MTIVCAVLKVGSTPWKIFAMAPPVMATHYGIEYNSHFTNCHITAIGLIGATEQLLIQQGFILATATFEDTNDHYQGVVFTAMGRDFTFAEILIIGSSLAGINFEINQYWGGFSNAVSKLYALQVFLPYCMFYMMLYGSTYSRFWSTHVFFFLHMTGGMLTYITAILNVNTMAKIKFSCCFVEPFIYMGIVYMDVAWTEVGDKEIGLAYLTWYLFLLAKYVMYMRGVITSLLEYLGLPFITVVKKIKSN
jgi:hypothetical protein